MFHYRLFSHDGVGNFSLVEELSAHKMITLRRCSWIARSSSAGALAINT